MSIPPCPFCTGVAAVLDNGLAWACFDKNPVTRGHLLLVTRRHVPDWFLATAEERGALMDLVDDGHEMLEREFQPDGYNVGLNVGAAAGQTIPHLHVHLIPRYVGDCPDPRGGVRGVIPARQWYPPEGEPA